MEQLAERNSNESPRSDQIDSRTGAKTALLSVTHNVFLNNFLILENIKVPNTCSELTVTMQSNVSEIVEGGCMRTSAQHVAVVKKVNQTLRILKRGIENKAGDISELICSLATTENSL